MKLTPLSIEGAWIAESKVFHDERGYFREWFKSESLKYKIGRSLVFEQANVALSSAGVIRGIHYSLAPMGQAKWITCVTGAIRDVVIDLRKSSPTFGNWEAVDLQGDSGRAIFISEGLGHGYLALRDHTTVVYLVSTPYSPNHEMRIDPFDEKIGIDWGANITNVIIAEQDKNSPSLLERMLEGKLPD